jgi:low affinity Fe/Cu permease
MNEAFRRIATFISRLVGMPWAFSAAVALIIVWLLTGPIFGFSDTWQLVINTGTTIITFLMVFLIQNTQNRETKAINLKLDELIRAVEEARNTMVDVEDASDEELESIEVQFQNLREEITSAENELNGLPGRGKND